MVRAVRLGRTSMTSELAIERGDETAAEGELRHVFVDPEDFGKREMPAAVRAALARFEAP